jgi:hypothetical protein
LKAYAPASQDQDGSHIKGLIMNYLHHSYPSLLRIPGFLLEFITPIVKVWPLGVFVVSWIVLSTCFNGRPALPAVRKDADAMTT